jgi:hypothetical protein
MSGKMWCSIWWLRLPVMTCSSGLPDRFAEPIIWRTYHWPRVSPSSCSSGKVSTPSGKCPQKITACAQKLRTVLATRLAAALARNPLGPDIAGYRMKSFASWRRALRQRRIASALNASLDLVPSLTRSNSRS